MRAPALSRTTFAVLAAFSLAGSSPAAAELGPPPGSLGEIKWDGATGVYIVVDRVQDMFFVLMEDSPSERMHVEVTLKKIVYDAFAK
jgi:CubicO group peptidase (beta-lactamase class C family)